MLTIEQLVKGVTDYDVVMTVAFNNPPKPIIAETWFTVSATFNETNVIPFPTKGKK